MKTQLFIIDPQNDFCDIPESDLPRNDRGEVTQRPQLSVVGANADMHRLGRLISTLEEALTGITVTLDSHPSVAVERTTFWRTGSGEVVAPFTFITADDVRAGRYVPRNAALTTTVLSMLVKLSEAGKPGMVVWPVHCVTGTWGHNIHGAVAAPLDRWEIAHQRAVRKVLKGEYPLSEHFGVFEAEVPVAGVASTQYNEALHSSLTEGTELLLVAGEASSHCVSTSTDQFLARLTHTMRIVLLTDCMSPVSGFESQAEAFFHRAAAKGVELMTSEQAVQLLA